MSKQTYVDRFFLSLDEAYDLSAKLENCEEIQALLEKVNEMVEVGDVHKAEKETA